MIHLIHLLGNIMFEYLISNEFGWVIMPSTSMILLGWNDNTIINWGKVCNNLIFVLLSLSLSPISIFHHVFNCYSSLVNLSRIWSFIWLSLWPSLSWFLVRSFFWTFTFWNSWLTSRIFWILRIARLSCIRLTNRTNGISRFSGIGS